jgi:phosphopantothenoylcysteine decarboxylase/phosphopantothenate--cysteine ligase
VKGRRIVVGVTGGIAAYKACALVSLLVQAGAEVRVVMTENAQRFVGPLTFQTLSSNRVITDLFISGDDWNSQHIVLARWADAVVVAPATAVFLGKIASGVCDDALTCTVLATEAPVLMAPAMNGNMWRHPAVQRNCETLTGWGYRMVGPAEGRLAEGTVDVGRMSEPPDILDALLTLIDEA